MISSSSSNNDVFSFNWIQIEFSLVDCLGPFRHFFLEVDCMLLLTEKLSKSLWCVFVCFFSCIDVLLVKSQCLQVCTEPALSLIFDLETNLVLSDSIISLL